MKMGWTLRNRAAWATACLGFAVLACGVAPQRCSADWIQIFETDPGATNNPPDNNPIASRATFTFDTGAGTLTVLLQNLLTNPKAVNQNLSDLLFTFNTGQTTGALLSSFATERTINADDTYTDGPVVATGWVLRQNIAGGLKLDVLGAGAAGPEHTIVGPPDINDLYSAANASLKNNPHNPQLAESATFVLSIPGLTDSSRISTLSFSYGTESGNDEPGREVFNSPEPSSVVMALIAGAAAVGPMVRRWRKGVPA